MSLDRGTVRVPRVDLLRTKTLSIFSGSDERPHHFGGGEVAVELIQLRQPEVIAGVICALWIVRIAAEVTLLLEPFNREQMSCLFSAQLKSEK